MMFRNTGHGIFENVSDRLGPDFLSPRVSRGAAVGDFDNDGDLDILVNNCGGAPQLLRNDGGNANRWLEILLIGTKSNRDGVGARVKVSAGDLVLYDQRKGGMSYRRKIPGFISVSDNAQLSTRSRSSGPAGRQQRSTASSPIRSLPSKKVPGLSNVHSLECRL